MTTEVRRNPLLPVEAICPKSREVKFQFDTLSDAAAAGFVAAAIRPCLAGGIVNHAGLWWRMIGDETPLPELLPPGEKLAVFVSEHLHEAPGHLIPFGEFYKRFQKWLPVDERPRWSQIKTSRTIPLKFQTGKGTANKVFLINASWEANAPVEKPYAVTDKGQIRRVDSE